MSSTAGPGDPVRVVERHPVRDPGAPVVPDHGEPVVAQRGHQRDLVGGHRAERVPGVVGAGLRARGLAVAPQVGGDHGVRLGQLRRDPVPHPVRLREAVQQQHRRAVAADAGVHRHCAGVGADGEVHGAEAIEHATTVPADLPAGPASHVGVPAGCLRSETLKS